MARKNIFPLAFKPGVNRDQTPFEAESCTDAFWMRWYGGRARAMGGQLGVKWSSAPSHALTETSVVSDFLIKPGASTARGSNDLIYIAVNHTIPSLGDRFFAFTITTPAGAAPQLHFSYTQLPSNLIKEKQYKYMGAFVNTLTMPADYAPQVLRDASVPIFLGTTTKQDLFANSAPVLYAYPSPVAPPSTWTKIDNNAAGIDPTANGGLCWVEPYLFLYGSNGIVQYSANNNPLDFTIPVAPTTKAIFLAAAGAVPEIIAGLSPEQVALYTATIAAYDSAYAAYQQKKSSAGGKFSIASGEKVLFGSQVRGGSSSPSVLFWTTKKVILISNTADDGSPVTFRIETLSKSSSVLSSRCIIEYDGMFFWPGTKRFYVYNGIVGEMVNDMNRRFFFSNIDMSRRQDVFGVYNEDFGELWWFYWDLNGIQRAIIYNKNLNTWYDTLIRRDAGKYYNDRGYFLTFGQPLVQAEAPAQQPDNFNYLWLHTENNIQNDQEYTPLIRMGNFNPIPINTDITWRLDTPNVSLSSGSLNPSAPGNDGMITLQSFEPDIRVNDISIGDGEAKGTPIKLTTYLTPYAQSPSGVEDGALPTFITTFFGKDDKGNGTEKVDLDVQQTNIAFRFEGTQKVQFGKNLMIISAGDKNRSTLN